MKLKLKELRFDSIEEIQAESQRVLHTDRNGLPGNVPGDGGTGVYMREGTTSRVMAADRPYGEFHEILQRQSGIFWISLLYQTQRDGYHNKNRHKSFHVTLLRIYRELSVSVIVTVISTLRPALVLLPQQVVN
jgi:hypothetical protein